MSPLPVDEFEIHVTEVSQSEITNLLRGYVLFRGERLPFSAVAYGRIGGQNVRPEFPAETQRRLQELGVNVDELELQMQQKMLEGDLVLEEQKEGGNPDV
jgi:hypothetical protein